MSEPLHCLPYTSPSPPSVLSSLTVRAEPVVWDEFELNDKIKTIENIPYKPAITNNLNTTELLLTFH